jgi:hypothetical protein
MAVAAGAAGSLDEGDVIIFAILAFVMIGCVVVGTGLGFGAIDRKLSNPVSLWIAALWNGIMTLALVVMMVIGILTRGG